MWLEVEKRHDWLSPVQKDCFLWPRSAISCPVIISSIWLDRCAERTVMWWAHATGRVLAGRQWAWALREMKCNRLRGRRDNYWERAKPHIIYQKVLTWALMPQKQRYFCHQPMTILFVEIAQNLLPSTHRNTYGTPAETRRLSNAITPARSLLIQTRHNT